MSVKHLIKTVSVFAVIIALGLVGLFLVNQYDQSDAIEASPVQKQAGQNN